MLSVGTVLTEPNTETTPSQERFLEAGGTRACGPAARFEPDLWFSNSLPDCASFPVSDFVFDFNGNDDPSLWG